MRRMNKSAHILHEDKAEVDPKLLLEIVNPDILDDCSEVSQIGGGGGEVSWRGAVQSSQVLGVNLGELSLEGQTDISRREYFREK